MMQVYKSWLIPLFSITLIACGNSNTSNNVTPETQISGTSSTNAEQSSSGNNNDLGDDTPVAIEQRQDGDEQWSTDSNEQNQTQNIDTPPNENLHLVYDSDVNWVPGKESNSAQ